MAPVTVAPIQARTAGTYRTPERPIPAGTYASIIFKLIFNNEAVDFVVGDEIDGTVEISMDGGANWSEFGTSHWVGGANTGRGYTADLGGLTVPNNSLYRARADVRPVAGGSDTVKFGVTADAILA